MASKFNARVRALSNAEISARKAEIEVAKSLTQLLKWELPFELLKESQAGKPIRKVEVKCGRRSDVIANLSKVLINHWMTIVKTGNESKKNEEGAKNSTAVSICHTSQTKNWRKYTRPVRHPSLYLSSWGGGGLTCQFL